MTEIISRECAVARKRPRLSCSLIAAAVPTAQGNYRAAWSGALQRFGENGSCRENVREGFGTRRLVTEAAHRRNRPMLTLCHCGNTIDRPQITVMKCDNCNKPATVHLTEIRNG